MNQRITPEIRAQKQKDRFQRSLRRLAGRTLAELEDLPCEVDISYFTTLLNDIYMDFGEIRNLGSRPKIGIYCILAPLELIYAADAQPVRLDASHFTTTYLSAEEIPKDACSLVKSTLGMQKLGMIQAFCNPALALLPTTCDCKRRMIDPLSSFLPVAPLNFSFQKTGETRRENNIDVLWSLKNTLEEVTGNTITAGKLKESMKLVQKCQKEIYELYRIRQINTQVIKDTHIYAILNSFFFDHIENWTAQLAGVNKELRKLAKKKNPENKVHLLLTGSPVGFPNLSIAYRAEKLGAVITANETCLSYRMLYDPVSFYDVTMQGMLESLMHRYVMACHCPSFVRNNDRRDRLAQLSLDFKADGALYHVLRGCIPYDYEFLHLEKELGLPSLRVESDLSPEDAEQMRIRLEAFIEMLSRKKLKKR